MTDLTMQIENWPITRPKPYPKNARKWNAQAVEKVAASIREYGWRQPIVVDSSEIIVIGHLRLAAAKSLGLIEVPVHVALDLTPAQVRGLRLADNRTHEEAEWDLALLAPEIAELSALAFDLSKTGFDGRELDALLRDTAAEEAADQAPPLPEVAVTRQAIFGCAVQSALSTASCAATPPARRLWPGFWASASRS